HELGIWWDDPADSPNRGRKLFPTLAAIVEAGYHSRGGKDPDLPGTAAVSGSGRVDLRLALDKSGELYLLSKSDGMIRVVTGGVPAGATTARPHQHRLDARKQVGRLETDNLIFHRTASVRIRRTD